MGILDQFVGEKIPAVFNADTPVGYHVRGPILDVKVANRTDYKTGDVLYFKDGQPKRQIVITIQTDIRDPQIPEDDGRRRVYVKMDYKSEREGLNNAVRAAGDDDVHVGGELAVQFLGQLMGDDGQKQAWNTTRYEYRKPSNLAAAGGIPSGPTPPAPAAQPPLFPPNGGTVPGQVVNLGTAPVSPQQAAAAKDPAAIAAALLAKRQAAQAPAPAAPVVDAATSTAIRSLIAAGLDDDTIAGAYSAVPRALIVALRNASATVGA